MTVYDDTGDIYPAEMKLTNANACFDIQHAAYNIAADTAAASPGTDAAPRSGKEEK